MLRYGICTSFNGGPRELLVKIPDLGGIELIQQSSPAERKYLIKFILAMELDGCTEAQIDELRLLGANITDVTRNFHDLKTVITIGKDVIINTVEPFMIKKITNNQKIITQ